MTAGRINPILLRLTAQRIIYIIFTLIGSIRVTLAESQDLYTRVFRMCLWGPGKGPHLGLYSRAFVRFSSAYPSFIAQSNQRMFSMGSMISMECMKSTKGKYRTLDDHNSSFYFQLQYWNGMDRSEIIGERFDCHTVRTFWSMEEWCWPRLHRGPEQFGKWSQRQSEPKDRQDMVHT